METVSGKKLVTGGYLPKKKVGDLEAAGVLKQFTDPVREHRRIFLQITHPFVLRARPCRHAHTRTTPFMWACAGAGSAQEAAECLPQRCDLVRESAPELRDASASPLASHGPQQDSGGSACVRQLRGVAYALGPRRHLLPSEHCESTASTDELAAGDASIASPVARLISCHGCGIASAARCEPACVRALIPSQCAAHCSCLLRCVAQALARRRQAHRRERTSSS
jgi:hypothetical protein